MRAKVPASTANLGPGFDTLAMALQLYVEVEVEPADAFGMTSAGEGSEFPCTRDHMAARVAIEVAGTDNLAIHVDSQIPVSRGLGSSAALAVAAAAAAGADDAFAWGVRIDGHPENAAASAFGGLLTATTVGEAAMYRHLPLDPALRFVMLVPDLNLSTEDARQALPPTVGFGDATFNLGRMGLMIAGLADHRQLTPEAGADRLHQDARGSLFPQASAILRDLVSAGARAATWSGAGPTLLAITTADQASDLHSKAETILARHGVTGRVLTLEADLAGLGVRA